MLLFLFTLLFTILFILIFFILNFILSFKLKNISKMSYFESGFLGNSSSQSSFSIHFFIILIMFVIFDLEIVMILGLIISDFSSTQTSLMILFFIFFSFYLEWYCGKLMWIS